MYGTIAKLKANPGNADKVIKFLATEVGHPVGYIGRVVYQMDNDPDEIWVAGWFESKEAYFTHSDRAETHQIYLRLLELLVAEPEWHDGELVFSDFYKGIKEPGEITDLSKGSIPATSTCQYRPD